jgi:tryptophan-rich sensory protein
MKKSYLAVFFWIIITLAVGLAAGMVSRPDTWYFALSKPSWNPPAWIFAPVWILLYALMGAAAGFIWQRRAVSQSTPALSLYVIQLILNIIWPLIFFGMHNPGLAFAEICLLWLAIMATLFTFWRVYRPAGILLIPYILWVSFATVLNFTIWRMNISFA